MLSSLAQAGTNAITCQGFGGIAAIGLGLMNSGTIKIDFKNAVPFDNATLAALPKEPISILSEGNKFEITIQDTKVTINEMAIVPFAVVTALHIVFTTIAFFFALPAYLALGAIWRISVLIGYPLVESDNKKWRKRILLILFLPTSVIGMIFGIVGMGKAAHFTTGHGIFGLLTFLLIIPTIVTSIQRLNTSIPIPPPSAFLGFKQIPSLFKGPQKVHFISAILLQMLLQFGTIAWATGFSELRSISLCIVDAILTAPAVVGGVTAVLFLQIGSMSIVGLRGWLEQRIAKKEKEASEGIGAVEFRTDLKKSDTMKTFGFGSDPSKADNETQRPELRARNTGQLMGREDSTIGLPTNVRKIGDEEEMSAGVKYVADNPFVDPKEKFQLQNQLQNQKRTYNEKLGGYETDEENKNNHDNTRSPSTAYRPSSEIIVDSRYLGFTADRRPYADELPLVPRKSEDSDPAVVQRYKSFSRPTLSSGRERERESGEEIRVTYPSGIVDSGNPYGHGR